MPNCFDKSVADIWSEYRELGHSLGWRFLCSSKESISGQTDIILLTTNPGGDELPATEGHSSCESGSAFLVEHWRNGKGPGLSALQLQIQRLFRGLALRGAGSNGTDLLNAALTGYFVPFRSLKVSTLHRSRESFAFAERLWSVIFEACRPKLIVCIDTKTFKGVQQILNERCGLQLAGLDQLETGWGKGTTKPIRADLWNFVGDWNVRVLRLPHLSRYKLFSSDKCKDQMELILDDVTKGIWERPPVC